VRLAMAFPEPQSGYIEGAAPVFGPTAAKSVGAAPIARPAAEPKSVGAAPIAAEPKMISVIKAEPIDNPAAAMLQQCRGTGGDYEAAAAQKPKRPSHGGWQPKWRVTGGEPSSSRVKPKPPTQAPPPHLLESRLAEARAAAESAAASAVAAIAASDAPLVPPEPPAPPRHHVAAAHAAADDPPEPPAPMEDDVSPLAIGFYKRRHGMMSFNLTSSFACKAQRTRMAEARKEMAVPEADFKKFKQRMLEEVKAVRAKADALEREIKQWR